MIIPNAKKITLNNGLRIIIEEIPSMRSVTTGILVGAGSGGEAQKEAGISHFIEHMLFKGTSRRSAFDIARALDTVGGKINAYTSKEYTMYYAVVLDRHVDTAIDVLCDILKNSLFDSKAMEFEKGVVLEEIKMHEDTPDELIHDFFTEKILNGHSFGKPIIGSEKSIKNLKRENILEYLKEWYSPQNTIISFAGAVTDRAVETLKDYLTDWKGKKIARPPLPPVFRGGLNLKKKKTEQVHLCLGVKGVSQIDEDRYPYAILDNILGGSPSSRLFQEVREKRGLVYSIHSISSPFRDFGISYVYAGTSGENLKQVVDLILEQFANIKKLGVKPDELARAKEYLKGTLVLGLESTFSRMNWLAKSEFYYGRTLTIDEIFERVDRVCQDDIIRLANQFFRNEYLALAVIGDLDELPVKEIRC